MGRLTRRLELLERRRAPADTCPEHRIGMPPGSDWRPAFMAALRAFSPYQEDRDAYRAEQDRLAATPPCPRCGWKPTPIYVRVPGHWGQYGPGNEDGAA